MEEKKYTDICSFMEEELKEISVFYNDVIDRSDIYKPKVLLSDDIFYSSYGGLSEPEVVEDLKRYSGSMKKTEMYDYFRDVIDILIQNLEADIKENKKSIREAAWTSGIRTLFGCERITEMEGTAGDKEALSGSLKIMWARQVNGQIRLGGGQGLGKRLPLSLNDEAVINGQKNLLAVLEAAKVDEYEAYNLIMVTK